MKTKITPQIAPQRAFVTRAQIAHRAYDLWLEEGCPENRELAHWLEAERALGAAAPIRDEAFRLTPDPIDPATSDAAKVDEAIDHMVDSPSPRSSTAL